MSLCWIAHWCSSSLSDLHCLPVSFKERAKETVPSCFCDYMHTLICVCVTVFTCNEKVFALSLCIRMMWFVHTCGGLCACVFEVMLGKGKKTGTYLTRLFKIKTHMIILYSLIVSGINWMKSRYEFLVWMQKSAVFSVSLLSQSTPLAFTGLSEFIFKELLTKQLCTHSWQSCTCSQKQKHSLVKGLVHPKMKMISLITHPDVVLNP